MARNRIIYQSEALYISKDISSTGVSSHVQLDRVQSANYSFTINRQDINQFGELSRIGSVVLEPPTVNLDFTYYLTDGANERAMSFHVRNTGTSTNVDKTFLSGHMVSNYSGQNFYILTTTEGNDINNSTGEGALGVLTVNSKSVVGIGNAYVTNYSLDASVGNLPTVSVSFEGANMNAVTGVAYNTGVNFTGWSGISLASVDPSAGTVNAGSVYLPTGKTSLGNSGVIALRPGDIKLNIEAFDVDGSGVFGRISGTSDAIHIQSATLAIPLARTPIQKLGTRFAFARPLDLPASATLSVSAIVNEMTAENLASSLDGIFEKEITLTINNPGTSNAAVVYTLKKCRLDSESFTSSIGANKTVDLVFSTQYASINDTTRGVFMSGLSNATLLS